MGLTQDSGSSFRRERAGLRRARSLVRRRRNAPLRRRPCLDQGSKRLNHNQAKRPEAKTSAQRGLSRRPDCARAGLRRARAHEDALSSRASKANNSTERSRDRALADAEFLIPASEASASRAMRQRERARAGRGAAGAAVPAGRRTRRGTSGISPRRGERKGRRAGNSNQRTLVWTVCSFSPLL